VLVMSFLGADGWPAPQLKELSQSEKGWYRYVRVVVFWGDSQRVLAQHVGRQRFNGWVMYLTCACMCLSSWIKVLQANCGAH